MFVLIVIAVVFTVTLCLGMHQFWNWRYGKNYRMPPRASLMLAMGSFSMIVVDILKMAEGS